jgi:hypothetical protein
LLQNRDGITWLVTTSVGVFPDSVANRARAERALGFFQLDGDPALETLLSSRDSLYIYDDAVGRAPRVLQVLANPTPLGFDVFGADAASGDLDGDGRLEIACGDAEGHIAIFERLPAGNWVSELSLDTGGTYAYDLTALGGGGFVCGRQRTASVTGDGFGTALYEFSSTNRAAKASSSRRRIRSCRPKTICAPAARWRPARRPAMPGWRWCEAPICTCCAHTAARTRGAPAAADFELVSHQPGAAGEPPALLDLDADGRLDVVLRTRFVHATWWTLDEASAGTARLAPRIAGRNPAALELAAGRGRHRTRASAPRTRVWETIATDHRQHLDRCDAAAAHDVRVSHSRRCAVVHRLGSSNIVDGRRGALPRLYGLEPLGDASIRLRCTNPLPPSSLETSHWRLLTPAGRRITGVALAADGREVQLLLDARGGLRQRRRRSGAAARRSGRSAARSGGAGELDVQLPRSGVRGVALGDRSRRHRGGVQPAPSIRRRSCRNVSICAGTADRWRSLRFRNLDPQRILLQPAAGESLVGIGIPYLLRISAAVRAASDGATLALAETEYVLRVAGAGARGGVPGPESGPLGGFAADVRRCGSRDAGRDLQSRRRARPGCSMARSVAAWCGTCAIPPGEPWRAAHTSIQRAMRPAATAARS